MAAAPALTTLTPSCPEMSVQSSASRSPSPDAFPGKRTAKRRKVLSCYACRSRKMKCDRVFPVCGRCARTGRANSCAYDPRLLEPQNGNPPDLTGEPDAVQRSQHIHPTLEPQALPVPGIKPPDTVTWKLKMQEQRIEMLEKQISILEGAKNASHPPTSSPLEHQEPGRDVSTRTEAMLFRGKSFKTQFYGPTSPLSLLSHVRTLPFCVCVVINSPSFPSSISLLKKLCPRILHGHVSRWTSRHFEADERLPK
jgi:hypothetical protein